MAWTLDLVELSSEIVRYQQLRTKCLMLIALWCRSNCNACRRREYAGGGDADGAALARSGFDQTDINAEVFVRVCDIRHVRSTDTVGTEAADWIASEDPLSL